jgi:hypothetical protein
VYNTHKHNTSPKEGAGFAVTYLKKGEKFRKLHLFKLIALFAQSPTYAYEINKQKIVALLTLCLTLG